MNFSLVEFKDKRRLRRWLRSLYPAKISYSSIYLFKDSLYLVMATEQNLTLGVVPEIRIFNPKLNNQPLSLPKLTLFNWGQSEILQSLDFIQYESQSTLTENGRALVIHGTMLIRSFDYLADIFGVLNYTPDSFSDGGKYNQIDLACSRIIQQVKLGVKIIDIGAESSIIKPAKLGQVDFNLPPTQTDIIKLSGQEEITRLKPLLAEVIKLKQEYKFLISVDTYHSDTAQWLLNLDIDILNDVSGKIPLELVKQFTENNRQYVAMHSLMIPTDKTKFLDLAIDPVEQVYNWMQNKLQQLLHFGINLEQVVLDPGIGFGKNPAQDWYTLNHWEKFQSLPCAILLGHSRKFFISHVLDTPPRERDLATAIVAASLIKDVDYLRLHDITNLKTIYPIVQQLSQNKMC